VRDDVVLEIAGQFAQTVPVRCHHNHLLPIIFIDLPVNIIIARIDPLVNSVV
jgi:hypothetical protein